MTNFGAKILNNAIGALSAQQAAIATIGNNIANVNTPGYARRVVDLQTRVTNGQAGSFNIGNGVQIGDIQRVADTFIDKVLRESKTAQGGSNIELEFMKRIEGLFSVSNDTPTIGSTLSQFFNSLNDLTLDPSSIELRKNVIERAQDVITTIGTTYNTIANLQTEADTRLTSEIDNVNNLAAQIADLNGKITQRESGGITAGDERDRRDILLQTLAGKIGYTMVENSDASVTISLANGFSLVNGTNVRPIELTESPSFSSGNLPPSLGGGVLRHVVYDYSNGAGTAEIDLTQILKDSGGEVGALLNVRGYNDPSNTSAFEADGILVEMASRVESISRELLLNFNRVYLADDDSPAAGHQATSADLDGNQPTDAFAFFDFTPPLAGTKDSNGNGLPDATDLDDAGLGVISFSSILRLNSTDPRRIAAARDSDVAAGSTSFEPGNGENAKLLAELQSERRTFTTGNYLLEGTFSEVFNESVTHIGNAKSRADLSASVAESNLLSIQTKRDEISGVSLDEEFTNLIKFQKAYQASARMIKIADDLVTQIIQLI